MNQGNIPKTVCDTLLKFDQTVEHLTEQATRTKEAIDLARERLTGGFERDQEYRDVRATLDKLVKDLPAIEDKRHAAERTLERCQAWLDELPDDVVLEPVKPKPNGSDLAAVREHIKKAEDELQTLASVPVPSSDIEQRVRAFVAAQGRPKVRGVNEGKLEVVWPSDNAVSLLALLEPGKMTEVILSEVERAANDPMPLDQRKKRMIELRRMIEELQRQALSLGADAYALPPQVILSVKAVKREAAKKVERRVAATGA